jgi:predicted ATPase/transcriptional regulator with XRE-family HTH domain
MPMTDGPGPFALLLQQYRGTAGLSQEELAERAGLSKRGISDLERGRRRLPHPATVRRLADALDLDTGQRAGLLASVRRSSQPGAEATLSPDHLGSPSPVPTRLDSVPSAGPPLEDVAGAYRASQFATTNERGPALPAALTTFVGRDAELAELADLIETVRLLTLTGPGGVGKSRLALQLARLVQGRFQDGAVFVGLASIQDATLVMPAIAHTLGQAGGNARGISAGVTEALLYKRLLLVLDNFEQVLGAAPAIVELLEACVNLKILVTTRAPLRVQGEQEFLVPPLRLPDPARLPDPSRLSSYDAVRLFLERARSVEPHFTLTEVNAPAVAEICCRLDGLPLALELAAARSRLLSPRAMLPHLEQRLEVLIGGPRDLPARQRTLRATIAWSYNLLEPAERQLFWRLSVFVGGFSLAAAQSIAGGRRSPGTGPRQGDRAQDPPALTALEGEVFQLLESLLAMSLVQRESQADGDERFSLLETIREFALERLAESGEERALRRRHANAYLTFAERARQELFGPHQTTWLARLEAEQGNLRAAFDTWESEQKPELALRLLEALHWVWLVHGHLTDGRDRAVRVARLAAFTNRPDLEAAALDHGSTVAFHLGDYAGARAFAEQGVALYRGLGQTHRLPSLLVDMAAAEFRQGDAAAARAHLDESLAIARQIDDMVSYSRSLNDLANLAHEQAEYALARSLYEEALALARQNDDGLGLATVINNLAVVTRDQGNELGARRLFEESVTLRRAIGDRHGLGMTLANLADLVSGMGDHNHAQVLLRESLTIEQDLGAGPGVAFVLERLASVAAAQGRARRALLLSGAAAAERASLGVAASRAAREMLDQKLAPAREALDDVAAGLAWAEGQALSRDAAVLYALTWTDD